MGRWSLIAATLLFGGALFATVWSTNRGVRDATVTLTRGQSTVLVEGVRFRLRSFKQPTTQNLEDILQELDGEGLRYVATLDRQGQVVVEAGTSAEPRAILEKQILTQRPGQLQEIGEVLRFVWYRPPRQPNRAGRAGRRRPTQFVLEFSPKVAADLAADARRTLTIGVVGAGLLLIAAIGLMRWVSRREALERALEHKQRLASLGQMSAVLAHEIRNPLASLKGNAQLLERSLGDDEKARTKAERVVSEAIRLEGLTNDLLEFARDGEIRRQDIDPGALLRETADAIAPDRIEVVVDNAPVRWSLDSERIRQVLTNLLENALGASEGKVSATAARAGRRLELVVRDHGNGIDEADLDKLFEPFFTRKTRGTGLGLAVTKRIVELHGGTITAANAEGGGAEFRVSIPRS